MESSLRKGDGTAPLTREKEARSASQSLARLTQRKPALGWLPEVVFFMSFGLLSIALAFIFSLTGTKWSELFFWLGILLIILPAAYRLCSLNIARQEHIGLLLFLGLSLYLVKVMLSPYMFTFSDELLHLRNAENIMQTGNLFGANTILPVSAYYPGLEIITTAIASLSGLSLFTSGLLVIGIARLIIILALFLLFEKVSQSSHIAGLAVLLYMANTNFLYWSAQFSYESLSLPLGILVLYLLAKQGDIKDKRVRLGLILVMFILIIAIIATHHITAYGLAIFMLSLSILHGFLRVVLKQKQPNTWWLSLPAVALTLAWLIFVATPTTGYLSQIFGRAIASVFQIVTGEQTGRALFTSTSGQVAPLWERVVGISSVLLIMLGILAGLYFMIARRKLNPFATMLTATALLYFITLTLRFTGAGWEVANRASEFLFIGIAFLIAFAFTALQLNHTRNPYLPYLFSFYAAILIFGGVIGGWTPALRSSQPLLVSVDSTTIQPQGLEAANWMLTTRGAGNVTIAPASDALLLLSYGDQQAYTGKIASIQELLTTPHELNWQTDILQALHARYLVMDRRNTSWDGMLGLYFSNTGGGDLLPDQVFSMFDRPALIPRLFDSGDIVIYDVGGISNVTPAK